jgi:hypothetical protein
LRGEADLRHASLQDGSFRLHGTGLSPPVYSAMSTRGINFLHQWLSDNLSGIASADVISVSEAIQKLFADAKALGITSTEIEEDAGSVYDAVLDAIVHHDPSLPE